MMQTVDFGFRRSPTLPLAPRASVSFLAVLRPVPLYFRDFFRRPSRVKLLLNILICTFLYFWWWGLQILQLGLFAKNEESHYFLLFCFFLFCFGAELNKLLLALTNIPTRFHCVLNIFTNNGNKHLLWAARRTDCQNLILSGLSDLCEKRTRFFFGL